MGMLHQIYVGIVSPRGIQNESSGKKSFKELRIGQEYKVDDDPDNAVLRKISATKYKVVSADSRSAVGLVIGSDSFDPNERNITEL